MTYSIMPTDWDYNYEKEIRKWNNQGCFIPTQIKEVVRGCGSLPHNINKTLAMKYLSILKQKFPFVSFTLIKETNNGDCSIIQVM